MVFVKTKSNLGKVETKSKRQLQTRRTQHQSQNVHIHIHKDDKPKRKRNPKPKPTNNYGRYDREASIYSQTNSPYEDMMAQNRALKPTINYTIPAQQQALALMTNKNNDLITEFLQNNNKKPLALPPSEPTTSPLLLHTTKKKPMILPPDTPTPAQDTLKEDAITKHNKNYKVESEADEIMRTTKEKEQKQKEEEQKEEENEPKYNVLDVSTFRLKPHEMDALTLHTKVKGKKQYKKKYVGYDKMTAPEIHYDAYNRFINNKPMPDIKERYKGKI